MKALVSVFAIAGFGAWASAQVVNPGFDSGVLTPWTVTPTPWGQTRVALVSNVDMDGPGPREAGPAAMFGVSQRFPNTGAQGISVLQPVNLSAPGRYRFSALWGVQSISPANANAGGIFELLFDDQVLGLALAPPTIGAGIWTGRIEGEFTLDEPGTHQIGVRVTRQAPSNEIVFHYLDDLVVEPACIADFNGSGGTPDDADVAAFFEAWSAGLDLADVNASGGTPDDADVAFFYERWSEGC